ncbi:hypothetical protein E3N88_28477 [Mikania micrantha]|uniref:Uncharacterized protein n=1 Tax=Mikania micrantha TaxID=192012 RepID=A0A5N6N0L1_9ASTR|nr:hypothetical protein E3N88_28477 [Mikania micrantha]
MVNVGENRGRNGVTDRPESRNEESGFLPPARYAPSHRLEWGNAPDVNKSEKWLKKSVLSRRCNPYPSFRRFRPHTHKINIQSIKTSILKAPQGLERTRERFCKSGSSFYPQNYVWIAINLSRNMSSEIINNINYLMTIKAMSLTLDVQKDSVRYHCEVRKEGKEEKLAECAKAQKMIFERHRPRSSRKCVMKVPAAVGHNMRTAVKGAAYAYDGLKDLNQVMMQKSCERTGRSPVKEQACRLCVASSVKEILGMLELSAAR